MSVRSLAHTLETQPHTMCVCLLCTGRHPQGMVRPSAAAVAAMAAASSGVPGTPNEQLHPDDVCLNTASAALGVLILAFNVVSAGFANASNIGGVAVNGTLS
jgi:hypothetical protein